jgi:hypothetical protein
MPRQKSTVKILVADGAGGMRPVNDLRFESGAWPVALRIPAKRAALWMDYLDAECESRGYPTAGLSQLDPAENSGTMSIQLAVGATAPAIELMWERDRNQALLVRARPAGDSPPALPEVRALLTAITKAERAGKGTRAHRFAFLTYTGFPPWRGELWLGPDIRLGEPTKHGQYLNDPKIITVDALVQGIGLRRVTANFQRLLREISIFLHIVAGIRATPQPPDHTVWVNRVENGQYIECELRHAAYCELTHQRTMPVLGEQPPTRLITVNRPGLGPRGIGMADDLLRIPDDINVLWSQFQSLPDRLRQQFLRAGNAFVNAQPFWPDQRTAYTSFLVVACEALKPIGRKFKQANVYDVVASFLNAQAALELKESSNPPQKVRSNHFHRGELVDHELAPSFGTDYFEDPSFDSMIRQLAERTQICLVEWLRCGGSYHFLWLPRPKSNWFRKFINFISRIWH